MEGAAEVAVPVMLICERTQHRTAVLPPFPSTQAQLVGSSGLASFPPPRLGMRHPVPTQGSGSRQAEPWRGLDGVDRHHHPPPITIHHLSTTHHPLPPVARAQPASQTGRLNNCLVSQ